MNFTELYTIYWIDGPLWLLKQTFIHKFFFFQFQDLIFDGEWYMFRNVSFRSVLFCSVETSNFGWKSNRKETE